MILYVNFHLGWWRYRSRSTFKESRDYIKWLLGMQRLYYFRWKCSRRTTE